LKKLDVQYLPYYHQDPLPFKYTGLDFYPTDKMVKAIKTYRKSKQDCPRTTRAKTFSPTKQLKEIVRYIEKKNRLNPDQVRYLHAVYKDNKVLMENARRVSEERTERDAGHRLTLMLGGLNGIAWARNLVRKMDIRDKLINF
jgi:hypothetical protein